VRYDVLVLDRQLPVLHVPGAQPLVRDRWERLVTTNIVPAEPQRVWQCLVDPKALRLWLARCHGSLEDVGTDCMLDFEDGEFFLVRPQRASPPADDRAGELCWTWRWLGIGQAMSVSWRLEAVAGGTLVTATEDAVNPPADWQTWNGGGDGRILGVAPGGGGGGARPGMVVYDVAAAEAARGVRGFNGRGGGAGGGAQEPMDIVPGQFDDVPEEEHK